MLKYKNANEAYVGTLKLIEEKGIDHGNTIAIYDHGFLIENAMQNEITDESRKWSKSYAEKEWQWYLSKNPSAIEISKSAKIWKNHMDDLGNVNSNYGCQINRSDQLENVIDKLILDKLTRQAWLTIYDAKDIKKSPFTSNGFEKDTPCTIAIGFQFYNEQLNMSVLMRSNDIKFGFCNDQYCFSKLFELVCLKTNLPIGTYYHYSSNFHKYKNI